jgi:hypothetical protein
MEEASWVELVRTVQRSGTGDLLFSPFPHPLDDLLTTIPHSGNYETLRDYASFAVVDSIKQQRTRKLQGLRMSWKLHKVVEQSVVCAREQELFKKDEKIAQMVVRFVTEQVRLPFPSFLDQESSLITSPCHRALRFPPFSSSPLPFSRSCPRLAVLHLPAGYVASGR